MIAMLMSRHQPGTYSIRRDCQTSRPLSVTCLLCLGLMIAVACTVRAEPDIKIASDIWGDARPSDIRALLRSVAEQFEPRFRGLPWPDIFVFHNKEFPI